MKNSLLLAAFLLMAFNLSAQDDAKTSSREAKRKIVPGLKVGVNRSNVYNESGNAFAASYKQGYAAGVFLALPLGGLLGFQPECVIQQKGFEGSGVLLGERYVLSRTTTHIDVPLQIQVKLFKWLTFLGGPNYSYMMRRSDSFGAGPNTAAQRGVFEEETYRKSSLGTILGIDLNFGHLVLSGRSGWDVTEMQNGESTDTPRYRNSWFQGTIGYRFY